MTSVFKRFLKNTSGGILPLTAVLLFPVLIAIGVAIDYTNFLNKRSLLQNAADAANLAAAREFNNLYLPANLRSEAQKKRFIEWRLKNYAQKFINENIGTRIKPEEYNLHLSLNSVQDAQADKKRLKINIDYQYATLFGSSSKHSKGGVHDTDEISNQIISETTLGDHTIEVALVLDNSSSMAFSYQHNGTSNKPASLSDQRLSLLKKSAKDLVDKLFLTASSNNDTNPVQFSLVPFSTSVNVGPIGHENHSFPNNQFMDIQGYTNYHNENLDWANTYATSSDQIVKLAYNKRAAVLKTIGSNTGISSTKTLNRLHAMDLVGDKWAGCVEMRPWPENTLDSYAPNKYYSRSNSDKLFVPYMAPDEPDEKFPVRMNTRTGQPITANDQHKYHNSYLNDYLGVNTTTKQVEQYIYTDTRLKEYKAQRMIRGKQLNRSNWLFKYQAVASLPENEKPKRNKDLTRTDTFYFADSGPNAYCIDQPIVQLTNDRDNILSELNKMQAHGATNIQQGLSWGWKTLSPALPFNTGRNISDEKNRKIIVLLTDGENQITPSSTPNSTYYDAWGYQRLNNSLNHPLTGENTFGRLLEGSSLRDKLNTIYDPKLRMHRLTRNPETKEDLEDLMNLHTNQVCNNMKDDGVSIFTVAFNVPDDGKVKDLLKHCSGSGKLNGEDIITNAKFYFDVDGSKLEQTFQTLAANISKIRLTQ